MYLNKNLHLTATCQLVLSPVAIKLLGELNLCYFIIVAKKVSHAALTSVNKVWTNIVLVHQKTMSRHYVPQIRFITPFSLHQLFWEGMHYIRSNRRVVILKGVYAYYKCYPSLDCDPVTSLRRAFFQRFILDYTREDVWSTLERKLGIQNAINIQFGEIGGWLIESRGGHKLPLQMT